MNWKSMLLSLAMLTAFTLSAVPEITIKTDREMPCYRCGEEAVFTVGAVENGKPITQGQMKLKLTEGGKTLLEQPIDFSRGNPARIKITLKEPGFVLATGVDYASLEVPARPLLAGAAFEPEKIPLSSDLPDDFWEFWENGRRQLADKPVRLTRIDKFSTDRYTSYRVEVDALNGEKLYGFLAVPVGRGPFPAYLTIPGAGAGASEPERNFAGQGVITLVMNVHKFDFKDAAELRTLYEEQAKRFSYPMLHAEDRDKYFFRNVILGVDRVINHVATMPEWDGKHFVYYGSSQGGGLGLILAGFNKHITAVAVNVPALCDHGGRLPGWPQLVRRDSKRKAVAPYYDAGNFARFITVPVLASAGYIDRVCPPGSVYAAFNQIQAPKKLIDMPLAGHEITALFTSRLMPWLRGQLGIDEKTEPFAK